MNNSENPCSSRIRRTISLRQIFSVVQAVTAVAVDRRSPSTAASEKYFKNLGQCAAEIASSEEHRESRNQGTGQESITDREMCLTLMMRRGIQRKSGIDGSSPQAASALQQAFERLGLSQEFLGA